MKIEEIYVKLEQLIFRADGRVEWTCKHECGHTIGVPKIYYKPKELRDAWFSHGCCGCCTNKVFLVV